MDSKLQACKKKMFTIRLEDSPCTAKIFPEIFKFEICSPWSLEYNLTKLLVKQDDNEDDVDGNETISIESF